MEQWGLSFKAPRWCPRNGGPSSQGAALPHFCPLPAALLTPAQPQPCLGREPPASTGTLKYPEALDSTTLPAPGPCWLTFYDGILDELHLLPEDGPQLVGKIP